MAARWTAQMDTPVGLLTVETTEDAVTSVLFGAAPRKATPGMPKIMKQCMIQLQEYFDGKRTRFKDLPLAADGTEFQKNVWNTAREIGYGATLTYGGLAAAMGEDGAARAVGNALNKNPVCVIVPCHRIVGANPQSGGYAGGIERKAWLLEHERAAR